MTRSGKTWLRRGISAAVVVAVAATAVLAILLNREEKRVYNLLTDADIADVANTFVPLSDASPLDGYGVAAETPDHLLLANAQTGNVALWDKARERAFYTALTADLAEASSAASGAVRERMQSPLTVTVTDRGGTTSEMTSFADSVSEGRFGMKNIGGGVEVTYLMGKTKPIHLAPKGLSESGYNALTGRMTASQKSQFSKRYRRVEKGDADYPGARDEALYVQYDDLKEYMLDSLDELLEALGYTHEEKEKDEAVVTAYEEEEAISAILIPVAFTLEGGDLVVCVDKARIRYAGDKTPLRLSLCEYFLAADSGESGYMLVPDGSGALIRLNNGKSGESLYTAAVYGADPALNAVMTTENQVPVLLPVYGIKLREEAVFAHIEEGAALASVNADVSGRTSAYNRVYPTFVLRQNTLETVYQSTAGGRQGVVYNNRLQEGELSGRLTVRYTLMPGADADYSAMAALLRERLAGRGVLTRSSGTQAPLLLDVVGAVETPQQVLGIPASVVTPLTRYDEVADMAAYFTDGGAGNLSVRLLGGTAGGEAHALRDHLRAESGLGGGQGFAAMAEALRTAGIQLYLQENFTAARREGLFDAFRKGTDAIRLLNRKYGRLYAPDLPTLYNVRTPYYAVTPVRTLSLLQSFLPTARKMGVNGLSLQGVGTQLTSDFNVDAPLFRDQAEALASQTLAAASEAGMALAIESGGLYAWQYADILTGMPSGSGRHRLADESIPFCQMVLHGYVDYVGAPINLSGNMKEEVLRAIETGSGVSGLLYRDGSVVLKDSDYSQYTAAVFDDQKETVLDACRTVQAALGEVYGSTIIAHRKLSEQMTVTEYDNGKAVVVNYGTEPRMAGGVRVEAQSYAIVGRDAL